jgi:hypothetical protein
MGNLQRETLLGKRIMDDERKTIAVGRFYHFQAGIFKFPGCPNPA